MNGLLIMNLDFFGMCIGHVVWPQAGLGGNFNSIPYCDGMTGV